MQERSVQSQCKYIPVQMNGEITGDVLIEISDNTVTGLIPPEIVFKFIDRLTL